MRMSNEMKDYYLHMPYKAYWSCLGIVELKTIFDNYIKIAVVTYPKDINVMGSGMTVSQLCVHNYNGREFIIVKGQRLYFDESISR